MSPAIVQSGRKLAACLAAVMACALTGAGAASAASFTVTTTADTNDGACTAVLCSLRDAVTAADNAGGSSLITVPAGTYTLTIPSAGANDPATGDLDIKDPSSGSPTSVIITGAGAGSTTITASAASAPAIDRVFAVDNPDASLTLVGVTVSGGQPSTLSTGFPNGGAVYSAGAFTANNDAFTGNAAGATGSGGAIDQAGSAALAISGTSFSQNTAAAGAGGAIADAASANAAVARSTFSTNSAQTGGALSLGGASYALDNDEFDHNSASASGGAISWSHGTLTGRADGFVGNHAGTDGGAVVATALQALSLTDVTLDSNQAQSNGGALAFSAATPVALVNDTVWNNVATGHGSAVSGAAGLVGWRDGVQNTILGAASGTAGASACDATLAPGTDNGHNLGTDSSCLSAQPGDVNQPLLMLAPPSQSGSQVDYDAEPAGAASIDAGSDAVCPPQDARGASRPQGAACDIGAYEYPAAAPVSTTTTTSTATTTRTTTTANLVLTTVTTSGPAAPAPGPPPSVTTRGAMAVTNTGAFLGGTVDPHGEATTYSFEIGTTTNYGVSTVSGHTDTGPLTVETRIAGLTPGTLYHYRMVATSAGGTSRGADRTFRTLPSYNGRLALRSAKLTVHAGAVAVGLTCLSRKPCLLRLAITVRVRLARTGKLGTLSFTRTSNPLVRIRAHRTVTLQEPVTPAGLSLLSKAPQRKLAGTLSTRPRSNQRGIIMPVVLVG